VTGTHDDQMFSHERSFCAGILGKKMMHWHYKNDGMSS